MTHLLKHLFKHPVPVGFATIWVISKNHDAAPNKFLIMATTQWLVFVQLVVKFFSLAFF